MLQPTSVIQGNSMLSYECQADQFLFSLSDQPHFQEFLRSEVINKPRFLKILLLTTWKLDLFKIIIAWNIWLLMIGVSRFFFKFNFRTLPNQKHFEIVS